MHFCVRVAMVMVSHQSNKTLTEKARKRLEDKGVATKPGDRNSVSRNHMKEAENRLL